MFTGPDRPSPLWALALPAGALVSLGLASIAGPGPDRRPSLRSIGALMILAATLAAWCAGVLVGSLAAGLAPAGDPLARQALAGAGAAAGAAAVAAILARRVPAAVRARAGLALGAPAMTIVRSAAACATAAPAVIGAMLAVGSLYALLTGEPPPAVAHPTLESMIHSPRGVWFWAAVVSVCLLTPALEELIFRVGLQSALRCLLGGRWGAIWATSLLFAALHLGVVQASGAGAVGGAVMVVPVLVLSLCLGQAYERTGDPLVPVVMHGLFNAGNVAFALWIGRAGGA